jgi:ribosomal protein L11 methyltransferase
MIDCILEIAYDTNRADVGELVQSRLYLTKSGGSSISEEGGRTIVSAYFESAAERQAARQMLAGLEIEMADSDRQRVDWLKRYRQSLVPLEIGGRFLVAPDAALLGGSARIAIIIPQEQAFGTGSHESTALCLEMLERTDLQDKRGLDVGTGSGILAIAMMKLGARRVIAFDNDLDAYAALRQNQLRNAVSLAAFIGGAESLGRGGFDVITMNILPEVIIPLLGEIAARTHGTLILSGILISWRGEIVASAAEEGLRLVEEKEKGEWWCGAFQRAR